MAPKAIGERCTCCNAKKSALLVVLLSPLRGLSCTPGEPCVEIALGGLGVGGRNVASVAAPFIDYQKNWNASLAARLGPPIVAIPGGVHPNASLAISLQLESTLGSQEIGMAGALKMMSDTGKPIIGLVGPTYSSVTMPIATVAAVRKIPQISCCATNPALTNKDSYPYFLRTVPPDSLQARALWHWILQFEVPLAACFYSAEGYGQGLYDALKELARGQGEQDRVQGQALRNMQTFLAEEARASIRLLKQIGSRFVVLLISWHLAPDVLDVLAEEGMLSPAWQIVASETMRDFLLASPQVGFMYFLPSGKGAKFPELQQLWSLLGPEDLIGTDHLAGPASIDMDTVFVSGEASELSQSEAFNFDAVYAFLIAINQLLQSGTDPEDIKGSTLLDELHRVRFIGTSGEVSFDENGDRFGTYELMNIQADGSAIAAASFNSVTSSFTFRNPLVWMDSSTGSLPPSELYSCDPGFYLEEQSGQCKKCPRGTMCLGGTASLMSCPRGTFAADLGMMSCTPCPRGSYASEVGSAECSSCPPGSEGPQEGMETCVRCTSGFYMPSAGASRCLPCGLMQITPGIGSTTESDCVCAEDSFMCGDRGCIACPAGLYCPEGLGPPQQQGGFWADPNISQCDFSVLRCRDQFECPAGSIGSCSVGREGQACNNCQPSHYPRGSICEDCSEGDALPVLLMTLLFLCILFFFSGSRWDPSQVSLNTVTAASVTGQLIMALQALGSIRELSIQWEEPVKTLINLTKILMFDFDFFRSSCFFGFDSPTLYFVSRLLTCPLACLLLVCIWMLNKIRGRPKPFNVVMNQCGLLVFAFFLSITRTTLIPFQCVPNPNGSSSMLLHPGIVCFESGDHQLFAALAVVGIVTQPVAVLALATYVIVSYPSRVASGKGLRFATRYRFLLHRFKPEAYYYGLVLLFRNALVALLPTVLVGIPELQVPLMGGILIAVQNLQLHICPWRTEMANVVDMLLTDLLLLMLLSAGPLLLTNDTQSTVVLGWLLCVPFVAVLLVALVGLTKLAAKHLRSKAKLYGIFLCHHKAGGGSLSRLLKILIAQRSSARVFLDSDQLENLDYLFDIVRTSVKNFVVVLTPELLSRNWCCGEIVTAWKNGVTTMAVVCDGFEPLSDEAQKLIPTLWSPEQMAQLANYGVEIEDIHAAYVWLQHELTALPMPRFGPVSSRAAAVEDLLSLCRLSSGERKKPQTNLRPRILIISSFEEAEYLSACEVFQLMLQPKLRTECEVVQDIPQMAACKPYAYYLVVLLFRGIFVDQDFNKLLLYASAYSDASKRALELVPVIADSAFDFLGIESLLNKDIGNVTRLSGGRDHQEKVLRSLRTKLALPFTPLASEGLQQRQVAEIAMRVHRYQDPVAAATTDENEDQFVDITASTKVTLDSRLLQASMDPEGHSLQCANRATVPASVEEPEGDMIENAF